MIKKKEETVSMIEILSEFKELKNIDKETMVRVLEESFRSVIARMFGTDENFTVIINPESGDFEIWRNRVAVADDALENSQTQIRLSDARTIDPDCALGEEVTDKLHFSDFGRRAILTLRQTLSSRIMELQKEQVYTAYKERLGHLIVAEVYQVWKREVLLLDDDGNELLLPKTEQIPSDFFRKGDMVRAIVQRVEYANNNPRILLSRTDNLLLQRLFELEVPEINDGLITIKAVARVPGERAKIAVESYDDRIDPVGACVGMKGSRIHGIVRELRNENIDVVNYTANISLFIQRAIGSAKVSFIHLHENERRAEAYVRPDEVALAIGKGGLNIKLACTLTKYYIEVLRDDDLTIGDDVLLDAFTDEIDQWIIDALKNIGCKTAHDVLALSREDIIERADLEEQTVDDILHILTSEFEGKKEEAKEEAKKEEVKDTTPTDTNGEKEPEAEKAATESSQADDKTDEKPDDTDEKPDNE